MTVAVDTRSAALLALSEHGVARDVFWSRSPSGLLTIAADVGIRLLGTVEPTPFDFAGATGFSLRDTLPRAAGEAIERYALARPGVLVSEAARPWESIPAQLRAGFPAGGSDHLAVDLRTGDEYLVPMHLIDCPAEAVWGGSPSGAASHLDPESALRAALREVVERDAAMVAWFAPADIVELAIEAEGRVFRAPTLVPGVRVYLGWCVTDTFAACGCAVDADDRAGAEQALREAKQIAALLRDFRAAPPAVRTARVDFARTQFWGSEAGVEAFTKWAAGAPREPLRGGELPDLLPALPEDALLLAVDLSYRLPAAVREVGWCVSKVIPLGLQPLVTEEAAPWSASRRLGSLDAPPQPLL